MELLLTRLRSSSFANRSSYPTDDCTIACAALEGVITEEGLVIGSTRRNSFKTYRGELSPASENIIARDFRSPAPNEKWLTDLSEFAIPPGKVYLSPMIACFDGLVISWSISPIFDADIVNAMLDEAISTLVSGETLTVHPDRGCRPGNSRQGTRDGSGFTSPRASTEHDQ